MCGKVGRIEKCLPVLAALADCDPLERLLVAVADTEGGAWINMGRIGIGGNVAVGIPSELSVGRVERRP